MIENFRQYDITKDQVRLFELAIIEAKNRPVPTNTDPIIHQAMIDGMESQLDDLKKQLKEFEKSYPIKPRV